MKKILVLTPRFPYPVIGGDRLRIYEICKELSKFYFITLASFCETKEELNFELPDDGVFSSVHRYHLPKWRSVFNATLSLPTNIPLQVAYYRSSGFKKMVDELISNHDLVIPHLVRMADYVKSSDIPKIIEMTDAISMNYSRAKTTKNSAGIRGWIFKIECDRLNTYEKLIGRYFDHTVFVSKYDKDFLYKDDTQIYNKSLVCSNGVDLKKLPFQYSQGKFKLVFIGNMLSAQNFDAAYWFSTEVMPVLRQHGPYEFHIIGRINDSSRAKLTGFEGVKVVGAVDDIAIAAKGALSGICSVRLAAGVQNKILEYMSLGIPTITTTTGYEGLQAEPNKDLLIADSVSEYVEHIISLKSDSFLSQSIANNALNYVKEHHSWSGKLSPLCDAVDKLINQ